MLTLIKVSVIRQMMLAAYISIMVVFDVYVFLNTCASKMISMVNVSFALTFITNESILAAKLLCLAFSGLSNFEASHINVDTIIKSMPPMTLTATTCRVRSVPMYVRNCYISDCAVWMKVP